MNILFVSEYYPPLIKGGGETNLALLAQELARQGMKVMVLTSREAGLPSYEQKERVEIYRRLKTGKNLSSVWGNFTRSTLFPKSTVTEIKKLKKEKSIDVIHFIGTSIIVAPQIKKLGISLFATIESYPTLCPKGDRMYHGKEECKIKCSFLEFIPCLQKSSEVGKMNNRWYLKYNPAFLLYNYTFYKKLNRSLNYCTLIAISNYVQKLLALYGHQSLVIPNSIDTSSFYFQEPKNQKPLVLYLGSLTKYKGPHILLEAMRGVECRGEFYGEGIMKEELLDLIKRYNLDAEIFSPVPYEKVSSLYARADIVVFPSLWPEPFGRIALEAMAAGKVVIGSNIGGIRETIQKDAGILVEAGNSDELRRQLKLIIFEQKLQQEYRRKGKEISERYTPKLIAKETRMQYEKERNPV